MYIVVISDGLIITDLYTLFGFFLQQTPMFLQRPEGTMKNKKTLSGLKVKQFRYDSDNLSYLLYGKSHALAIDGGAFKEILAFLEYRKLELSLVANTHGHTDHTSGNAALLDESNARLLYYDEIVDRGKIELEGRHIKVFKTPGHTDDSVCFQLDNILMTGDTLFNGTVGNCFTGNLEEFYHSIKKIMSLAGQTVIYAGHDYIKDAMNFARKLEPNNKYIEIFSNNYNHDHPVSTLNDEMMVNPYLRFNERNIIDLLKKNSLPHDTELDRWLSLMSIE